MTRQTVTANETAPAVGPYSHAVKIPGQVWVSGQIGMTATGELVRGGVAAEADQALRNLKAVLEAAGSSLERVVKATIYLADMGDFEAVNAVYAEFFGEAPPARVCVEVSGLPKGARFEVDAVAVS